MWLISYPFPITENTTQEEIDDWKWTESERLHNLWLAERIRNYRR